MSQDRCSISAFANHSLLFLAFRATPNDLYFPQVVICNSNFIQATFLEEYNITEHANLLIQYFFSRSPKDITTKGKKIVQEIEVRHI